MAPIDQHAYGIDITFNDGSGCDTGFAFAAKNRGSDSGSGLLLYKSCAS